MAAEEPHSLTKLREACLKRGAAGIKGFGRTFRIYDDNGSKSLDINEFRYGLRDYGIRDLTDREINELFQYFDNSGDGNLCFEEFLQALRPPMSASRVNLIKQAFGKLDKTGDGVVTVEDLVGTYSVQHHPKYKTGEWTKKQVLQEFLKNFETDGNSSVTFEEFLNYYAGVSSSIDQDIYFDYMMRNAWKL